MKNISIDLETYSDVNLQKGGVYKYVQCDADEGMAVGKRHRSR